MALKKLAGIAAAATVAGVLGVGGASLAAAQEDGSPDDGSTTTEEPSTTEEDSNDDGTTRPERGSREGRPDGEDCPKDGEAPDSSTEGSSDSTTGS